VKNHQKREKDKAPLRDLGKVMVATPSEAVHQREKPLSLDESAASDQAGCFKWAFPVLPQRV